MMRLIASTLLVVFGTAAVAAWPPQRIESPTLSVRTDLVTLSVTVVDQRGALVAGLQPDDFTVYDDGERRAIQFFTSEDLPATVGLVMDNSGSMRGRDDDRAAVAAAFAAMGRPLDEFFSVHFNDQVWAGLPPSVGFTNQPDRLRGALVGAPAAGMTALYDALERGLQHLQQGTRDRKALIVVSDGGDNASERTLAAVLDRARRAETVIYPLTFFDPDNRDARPRVLKKLAEETGGRVFTARQPDDVARAFAQVAHELRSGYSIGFAPAETAGAGFRPIRVLVKAANHHQLRARTRAGYYAGPPGDAIR